MKVTFAIVILLISSAVKSQTPEFFLPIRFFVNENPNQNIVIYLGFDSTASDSLEGKNAYTNLKEGGEQMYPPPFQYDDARFTGRTVNRPYLGDGSPIDIRRKPDSAAFLLNYEISITTKFETQSAHLTWNQNLIPPIIKHIFLEPGTISPNARSRVDMKTVSRFDMPNRDSISKYSKTIISLFYNMEPMGIVRNDEIEGSLAVYPNPIVSNGAFSFASPTPVSLEYRIIDVTGKQVAAEHIGTVSGLVTLPINSSVFPSGGAYYLRLIVSDSKGIAVIHRLLHIIK